MYLTLFIKSDSHTPRKCICSDSNDSKYCQHQVGFDFYPKLTPEEAGCQNTCAAYKTDHHIVKEAEKELGRVLIILGNQVEQIQSQVLGSFYAAYVKGAISWEKFCELSEANRRMFISDYQILFEAAINDGLKIQNRELYQVDRLISLGLLQNQNRLGGNVWLDFVDDPEKQNDIIVTSLGKTFYHNSPAALKRN